MLLLGMLGDTYNKTELTWKVWISCIQYSLNSSSSNHCVSSTLSRCENGVYDGADSGCEILCLNYRNHQVKH
jgi:hypothetical protein